MKECFAGPEDRTRDRRDQARGRFGQNNRPRVLNFALNWAQGEVGVTLRKKFFFFFRIFIKSFHKQAVMAI